MLRGGIWGGGLASVVLVIGIGGFVGIFREMFGEYWVLDLEFRGEGWVGVGSDMVVLSLGRSRVRRGWSYGCVFLCF